MSADETPGSSGSISPDVAFSLLGDETRIQILQTLGEATEPLAYSEVFDRVAYDDSSNFGYHLEKLRGRFVRKTDDGYELRELGRRVVEAVLSGGMTENPVTEPTETDEDCPFCGAPVAAGFQQGRVELSCTECPGLVDDAGSGSRRFTERGSLGYFLFPPAGVHDRTPTELLDAAWTWMHANVLVDSTGVCSRCSASLDRSVTVCDDHDATDGPCDDCGRRYATRFETRCPNCNRARNAIAPWVLLSNTELLAFLTAHGVNPLRPDPYGETFDAIANYDEAICSTDPFEARYTFSVGDEAITLTVDGDLSVVDVHRTDVS